MPSTTALFSPGRTRLADYKPGGQNTKSRSRRPAAQELGAYVGDIRYYRFSF